MLVESPLLRMLMEQDSSLYEWNKSVELFFFSIEMWLREDGR